jgi:hypothetical protein
MVMARPRCYFQLQAVKNKVALHEEMSDKVAKDVLYQAEVY